MTVDLPAVNRRFAAYERSHTDGFVCCNAHASADDVPTLVAEVEQLRAQVAAAYRYADDMAGFCSWQGIATRYAGELRAALDNAKEAS